MEHSHECRTFEGSSGHVRISVNCDAILFWLVRWDSSESGREG